MDACSRDHRWLTIRPWLLSGLQEKLLKDIWCGKMSTQLICKGCPHRSERDEQFYTMSLDIQNKKDILEVRLHPLFYYSIILLLFIVGV